MSTNRGGVGRDTREAEAARASAPTEPKSPQVASSTDSKPAGKRRRPIRSRPAALVAALVIAAVAVGVGWWYAGGGADGSNASASPDGGAGRGGGSPSGSPGQGGGRQPKPLLVEVEAVRRGEIVASLALSGEIVAADSVVIAAAKEGPVTYCPWREGDSVKAGQKLIEIDREVHRAEVEAAEAALRSARAKLADLQAGARAEEVHKAEANVRRWQATVDEASRNLERQQRLLEKRATSEQALDQAQERVEVAASELASAQQTLRMLRAGPTPTELAVQSCAVDEAAARLALAKAHLDECVITAPFDGMVTQVHIRAGDLATPRSPLMEMYAPASLVVRFSVPEAYAAAVRPGLPVRVRADAMPGEKFSAEVVRVYPQLDAAMRTRTVEARLLDPAGFFPHMFVRLSLELKRVADAVLVPSDAVATAPTGERFVFVVEEGTARRVELATGAEQNRTVQVLEGLQPGERVVVAGQAALREGQAVRIAGEGPAGGKVAADKPMSQSRQGKGPGNGKPAGSEGRGGGGGGGQSGMRQPPAEPSPAGQGGRQ